MINKIQLVLISSGNKYKRFFGRKMTDNCISDRPLTKKEIEIFRTNPSKIISDYIPPNDAA